MPKNKPARMAAPINPLEALVSAINGDVESGPIPEGFFNVAQLAEKAGCSKFTVLKKMKELHEAGKVEKKQFRAKTTVTFYYRMK